MSSHRALVALLAILFLASCSAQTGEYMAASAITQGGFVRNEEANRRLSGQTVKLWGYVDHGNLYGDETVKELLGDWWSGPGPDDATWRFNVKAHGNDAVGRSFAVHVPNDEGRDDLLLAFLADATGQRATKVFVTGTVFTFDAPTNSSTLSGLYMEVTSSADILLDQ